MTRFTKPIWTFLPGFLVSTNDTPDHGLETMVFPTSEDAGERYDMFGFRTYAHGVDWGNPFEEYTQHYSTVVQARAGHAETVKLVKMRIMQEGGRW